jgi:hypothetical protein
LRKQCIRRGKWKTVLTRRIPIRRSGKNALCEYILFIVVEFSRFSWEPAVCEKDSDREHQLRQKGPRCVYSCAVQYVHIRWRSYQLFLSSAHSSQLSTTPANRCVMGKIHLYFFIIFVMVVWLFIILYINKNIEHLTTAHKFLYNNIIRTRIYNDF